jgi:hypothetical protein
MKRVVILLAFLVMGCGASTSAPPAATLPLVTNTPTSTPTRTPPPAPSRTPVSTPVPTAVPTPTPDPATILAGVLPERLRASCSPSTYGVAPESAGALIAQIQCADGYTLIYLDMFSNPSAALAEWSYDFVDWKGDPECTPDQMVKGTYSVGNAVIGHGGGCADGGVYSWTVDALGVEGMVDTLTLSLAEGRTWFTTNRPFGSLSGKITGTALRQPSAKPTPKPTPVAYRALTSRNWALLVKAPGQYTGNRYSVWGCISQFDAATGLDTFRAQASYRNEAYWYTDGTNAIFTGTESQLANFVEGDVVEMSVVAAGSFSYDTQLGGSTTAPEFNVVKIVRRGSCG